jgi:TRAP-type transport system small permease protein
MVKKKSFSLKAAMDSTLYVFAAFLMAVVCITVLLQILFRYFLNNPLIWSEELSRYLYIWICMIGWVIATKNRVHIRVNFFADMFPEKVQKLISLLNNILLIIFSAFLVYYGLILSIRNIHDSTITLYVSFFYVYLSAPLGALLLIIYSTLDIISKIKESRK